LNAAEVVRLPDGEAELAVHADHAQAVADALRDFSGPGARYMGLVYYVAISYETCNHHHHPQVTKKLAKTTILLTGLQDWIAGNAEREGSVFHDLFHCVADTVKSNAARDVGARQHLSDLKFDNLRKRIPVKAPDSGVALNYEVLYRKARAYHHDPNDLPATLAPPANLAPAVQAYEQAPDAAQLQAAVAVLRAISQARRTVRVHGGFHPWEGTLRGWRPRLGLAHGQTHLYNPRISRIRAGGW
jgi:hypothetical protein